MNRRDFLKRIAAGAALVVLDFNTSESSAVLIPQSGTTAGVSPGQTALGGNLFTAYTRGGCSVNGPVQKLRLSQTRVSAAWKSANNHSLQQLL
jgi:hypothetical protein